MADVAYESENEDVEVELETAAKEKLEREKAIIFDDDEPNLVPVFLAVTDAAGAQPGKQWLKETAERVCDSFKTAYDGTKDYRERCARNWRLLVSELEKPEFPFEDCAAIHIPSYTENMIRLVFRVEDELLGDWRDVFRVSSMGPDDDNIAEAMTIHDNWQLRNKVTDFRRQIRRGILCFMDVGDVTYHIYWDELRRVNVPQMLTPDEFVKPYGYTSVTPDFSDLPWYAKIFHRYRHELQAMKDEWHDVDRVLLKVKPSWEDEPEMEGAKAAREVHGVDAPEDTTAPGSKDAASAPFKLVHWEGWLELPNRDRDYFCQMIFEPNTKALLCLKVHEEEDWQEKLRFEQRMAELKMYSEQMNAWQQAAQAFDVQMDIVVADADARVVAGVIPPEQAEAEKAAAAAQAPPELQQGPPQPPAWFAEEEGGPTPPRSVPIRMFRHAVFLEPLYGNLGYGYGRILADMNIAQDTMARQYVDSATLRNVPIGFTSAEVELPEDFGWTPGKFFRLEGVTASQLPNAVQPFQAGEPAAGLMMMVDRLQTWMSSAAQSSDVLSGASGKSGETARGHASRVEQATKMLAIPARKFAELLTEILKCNAKLNSIYLEDDEVVQVTDMAFVTMGNDYVDPNTKSVRVGRWMWDRNYHVEIQSDLRFLSRTQRIQEADEMVSMGQHPLLMTNMQYQITALRKAFEARGRRDMAALVVPPPPPPPPMPPGGGPGGGPQGPGGPQGGPEGAGGAGPPISGPGPSAATAGPPMTTAMPPMGPASPGPTGG